MRKRLKRDAPFVTLVLVYANVVFLVFGLPAAWGDSVKLGIWAGFYIIFLFVFFRCLAWLSSDARDPRND